MQFESLISFGPKYFRKMMIHSEKKCRKWRFREPNGVSCTWTLLRLCRHFCKLDPATSSVPYGLVLLNWALAITKYPFENMCILIGFMVILHHFKKDGDASTSYHNPLRTENTS